MTHDEGVGTVIAEIGEDSTLCRCIYFKLLTWSVLSIYHSSYIPAWPLILLPAPSFCVLLSLPFYVCTYQFDTFRCNVQEVCRFAPFSDSKFLIKYV